MIGDNLLTPITDKSGHKMLDFVRSAARRFENRLPGPTNSNAQTISGRAKMSIPHFLNWIRSYGNFATARTLR
jgi:hypothetical protein